MQQHALDNFKRVGVDVRTGVRVTEVRPLAAPPLLQRRAGVAPQRLARPAWTAMVKVKNVRAFRQPARTLCLCPRPAEGSPQASNTRLGPPTHPTHHHHHHRQVTKDTIMLKNGEQLKYGVCVWSAGNAPRPLVQQLAEQIPEQARRGPGLRPLGSWSEQLHAQPLLQGAVPRACSCACATGTDHTAPACGSHLDRGGCCMPGSLRSAPLPACPLPVQAEYQPGGKPSKLAVDPFLRRAETLKPSLPPGSLHLLRLIETSCGRQHRPHIATLHPPLSSAPVPAARALGLHSAGWWAPAT